MYLSKEIKQELFENHGRSKAKTDTGSAESQIALFTHRIKHLTEHLKKNKKDYSTQQGLLKLVGKRRSLLKGMGLLKRKSVLKRRVAQKEVSFKRNLFLELSFILK